MYRLLKSRLTQQLNKSRDAGQVDRHDQTRLFTIDDGAVGDEGTRYTKYKIHSFYDKVRNNKYTLVDSYYKDFSKTKNADFRAKGKKEKKYPSGLNPFGSDDEYFKDEIQNVKVGIDESNKKKYPSGFNPFGSDDEDVLERNQNIEVLKDESNKKKYPSGFNPFGSDDEDALERNQNIEVLIDESNKKKYPSGFNPFGSDDEDIKEENQNVKVGIDEGKTKKYPSGFNPFGSDDEDVLERNQNIEVLKDQSNKKKYPSGFNPFGSDDEDVLERNQNIEVLIDESNKKKYPSGFNPFGSDDEDVKEGNVELIGNKEKKYPSGINPFGSDEEEVQEKVAMNEELKKEQKHLSGLNSFGSNDEEVREGNVETQSEYLDEKNDRCILINSVKGELQEEEIKVKTEQQVRKKSMTHDVFDRDSETNQEENSETKPKAYGKDQEDIIFECILKENGELKYPSGLNPFGSDNESVQEEMREIQKWDQNEQMYRYNLIENNQEEVHGETFNIQSDVQKRDKCRLDPKYNVGDEVYKEKKEEQIEVDEEAQTNMLDYNVWKQSVNKYPTGLNPFGSDEEDFMQENLEVQAAALDEIKYMHNPCDNVEEEFQESKDVPVEMKSSYTPLTSDNDEVQEERINVKGDTGDEEKCTHSPFDSSEVKAQNRDLNDYDADDEDDDEDEDDDDYEMFGIMSVYGGDHQDYVNTPINIDPRVYEDYTFGVLGIYARGQEDRPMNDLYDDMVEEYDGFVYGLLGSSRHYLE